MYGVSKEYYRNGNIKEEIPYFDYQVHGVEKYYYSNGNIKKEIPHITKREIVLKTDDKNGSIKEEVTCIDYDRTGIVKTYDRNGNVKSEALYIYWKRQNSRKFLQAYKEKFGNEVRILSDAELQELYKMRDEFNKVKK